MNRKLWTPLIGVALVAIGSAQAQSYRILPPIGEAQGERIALVLGNGAYRYATPLGNPANDASDVTLSLRRVGFTVVSGIDLVHEDMDRALRAFADAARGADVAMFFYAGHGVQINGENYLLPVDAEIENEVQVSHRSIALGEVLDYLERSEARLKIVTLDACRDNPFRGWRSSAGGLAMPFAPSGSVISFATAPGARASDNIAGRNGLYTEAFLEEMETPGIELNAMFKNVRDRVKRTSGGQQVPWILHSYDGDFFFVPDGMDLPERIGVDALNAQIDEAVRLFEAEDYTQAKPLLDEAATRGHAEAESVLGYMYMRGLGVEPDLDRAVELLRSAAERGHPAAQTNLGLLYANGWGVERSDEEAARLFALAVEQGQSTAQNNLGALYQHGQSVEVDTVEAMRLYRLAAESGLPVASANLGYLLEHDGDSHDEALAVAEYRRATDAGHLGAKYRLARMLMEGRGVAQNFAEARRLLAPIAELGFEPALEALASLPE